MDGAPHFFAIFRNILQFPAVFSQLLYAHPPRVRVVALCAPCAEVLLLEASGGLVTAPRLYCNVPQFSAGSRSFSPLGLTLPDRNPPPALLPPSQVANTRRSAAIEAADHALVRLRHVLNLPPDPHVPLHPPDATDPARSRRQRDYAAHLATVKGDELPANHIQVHEAQRVRRRSSILAHLAEMAAPAPPAPIIQMDSPNSSPSAPAPPPDGPARRSSFRRSPGSSPNRLPGPPEPEGRPCAPAPSAAVAAASPRLPRVSPAGRRASLTVAHAGLNDLDAHVPTAPALPPNAHATPPRGRRSSKPSLAAGLVQDNGGGSGRESSPGCSPPSLSPSPSPVLSPNRDVSGPGMAGRPPRPPGPIPGQKSAVAVWGVA